MNRRTFPQNPVREEKATGIVPLKEFDHVRFRCLPLRKTSCDESDLPVWPNLCITLTEFLHLVVGGGGGGCYSGF